MSDSLRQQAQAGDREALETLLSDLFANSQTQARVKLDSSKILVLLESTSLLEFQPSFERIRQTIVELAIPNLKTVSIYARQAGEAIPDWGASDRPLELSTAIPVGGEYEFSASQNLALDKLIHRMRQTSYCLIGIGIALILPGILFFASGAMEYVRGGAWAIVPGLSQSFFPGLLLIVDGGSKWWGARELNEIVATEGHDIEHVMTAVEMFRKTHTLMAWVSGAGLILAIATVILFLPVFLALLQL